MNAIHINVDDDITIISSPSRVIDYKDFCSLRKFSTPSPSMWEIVRVVIDGQPFVMLVDEMGFCNNLPVNPLASCFYNGVICGDVIICKEDEFDRSEIRYLDDYETSYLLEIVEAITQ